MYVVVDPKLSVRDAFPRVTVVWEEEIAEYDESAALVAVTKHVPAEVDVNTPLLTAQPVVDAPFVTE
ncbi:superoxide dismutase [Cu-Zn] [Aurantimicrobium minutum]|uniref:Superoxide dismutase [Cu-Zn] n=1 Tax=Aurantimicrobium minutum TaxID=708131 RepID=A0A173LY67_9MICO|nr:superoxide dismutase [Cu-Zn] [Aurantimicrobium minutum]